MSTYRFDNDILSIGYYFNEDENIAEVYHFEITQEYRNRKYGSLALETIEYISYILGMEGLRIKIGTENNNSKQFLQSHEYTITDETDSLVTAEKRFENPNPKLTTKT